MTFSSAVVADLEKARLAGVGFVNVHREANLADRVVEFPTFDAVVVGDLIAADGKSVGSRGEALDAAVGDTSRM